MGILALEKSEDGKRGYWLVRGCDKARFYISKTIDPRALNRACNKHLSDKTGWGYWVDRCDGFTIDRRVAWLNLDMTDYFLDCED